ncbi:unnamed protein product, partial [Prorocentrum cordatum]
ERALGGPSGSLSARAPARPHHQPPLPSEPPAPGRGGRPLARESPSLQDRRKGALSLRLPSLADFVAHPGQPASGRAERREMALEREVTNQLLQLPKDTTLDSLRSKPGRQDFKKLVDQLEQDRDFKRTVEQQKAEPPARGKAAPAHKDETSRLYRERAQASRGVGGQPHGEGTAEDIQDLIDDIEGGLADGREGGQVAGDKRGNEALEVDESGRTVDGVSTEGGKKEVEDRALRVHKLQARVSASSRRADEKRACLQLALATYQSSRDSSRDHLLESLRLMSVPKVFSEKRSLEGQLGKAASHSERGAVFDKLGVALLDKAFHGFNSTIFAYGQTGSGKTHTMLNHKADADNRGLIPRIADSLYARIAEETAKHETRKFLVCCSFMEIYNEIIFDLLVARKNQPKGGLEVKEQKGLGVYVKDLQEMVIETSEKLQNVLEKGFEHRQTASTKMNDVSSRSHCIFVIKLHQKDTEDGTKNTFSKLNLVDLAGSERQKSTEAEGDRLKEGANINKSLSALGNVINALSSQSQGKKQFVPYRNSKLTRVLQESLGGNSLCTMVAAISPSSTNSEETLSTLNYAKRAKMIKVTATKNDEASQVKKLEEEVMALRRKLEQQASSEGMMSSKDKEEMESKYGAQIDELQSFMKQSWEEKQKLSEKYEEEQRRAAEEKARSAERVRHERARRLQLLEQNGDIELSLKAIASIGSDITKGLLEKIGEALKVQQQMESQLHAVRLYRESAASDFRSCTSCKASDAVALQTLLKQVHAKLGSMTKELDVLVRLESQLDESMGRIAPQVALASRQAEDRAGEGQDDREAAQELAELLGVVQRQLVQRQAGRHSKLAEDLQQLGLLPESQWLMQRLAGEAEEGAAPPTESTLALLSSLKARADGGEELAAPAARSGPTGVLGLSTFETKDELMGGSSNAESARCARLLQTVLFGGWCPETDSPEEYLEIDLGEERLISGMSIQGRMPCTSEWTQTRDLLQLSLSEMADKLPTAEKIFRRPPVRLIHDIGVVMAQERDCFAPWKVPPELLEFGGLSRDQKVAFFQELIDRTNQVGLGGAGMDELKVTPQDILKGNNCEETNRLLQVLAYLGLRAQRLSAGLGSGGGLLDLAPQWIETWRLRVFTEEGGWQWYGADQEAGGAHVFGGASDAAGTHFVGLPAAVPASVQIYSQGAGSVEDASYMGTAKAMAKLKLFTAPLTGARSKRGATGVMSVNFHANSCLPAYWGSGYMRFSNSRLTRW